MTHDQLLKLGQFLGYALEEGGLCSGFTSTWIRAFLLDDLETFYARINLLDQYKNNPHGLKDALGNINNSNISAQDRKLLAGIKPFFGILALYQAPKNYATFFEESKKDTLSQKSIDLVSEHTESPALKVHENFFNYDENRLISYLTILSQVMKEEPLSIYFGSEGHAIGVRILSVDSFEFINTNGTSQSTEILPITCNSRQLAKEIFHAYAYQGNKNWIESRAAFFINSQVKKEQREHIAAILKNLSFQMYTRDH